jgi:phytoene dehydrogenase-like protein
VSKVIIIGAGHNGLTAAFYLARAGLKPLVLERRDVVGGAAVTEDIAPGFRCPTLAHSIGPLRPAIVRDMALERRGVMFLRPDPRLVALSPDGQALAFSTDAGRTADAIRELSAKDAERYPDFCATLGRLGAFLGALGDRTPPPLDPSGPTELWELLKTGRRFRSLGRADIFRLLRWAPMAAADLVAEWFETDLLQAAVAARGIFGTALGPWSSGSGAVLLMQAAVDAAPGGGSVTLAGGPGALTAAMADAAREAGATIQTGSTVARIVTDDRGAGPRRRVAAVVLTDGREIPARAVISNADPRRTLLDLVEPFDLDPAFMMKVRNYRCPGTVAKMNLALSAVPAFRGVDANGLRGRLHVGPSVDYLERAFDASKYGELPAEPYLDITVPSLQDPSLAPPGRHVMSIVAQFTPYKLAGAASWDEKRDELAELVLRTLEPYAPGIARLVEHRQVLTPADLERAYSLTGGHIFHGEPSLDQLFTMRPILGWARYRTPIAGLYLCSAGTHGGLGITGAPGRNAAREVTRDMKQKSRQ